jgi:hypothetical protein
VYWKNKTRAEFFLVYIREAHTEDNWQLEENERDDIKILQPANLDERALEAQTCKAALEIEFPVLIDDMDNRTAKNYSAWPARLYVVAADGRIGYKGGFGPDDFDVPEMAAALDSMFETSLGTNPPLLSERRGTASSGGDHLTERTEYPAGSPTASSKPT